MTKSECQECGMMVEPTEFHNFKCCQDYKLAKKLVGLSEFAKSVENES